ncbi:MAG: FG-GAP-like repeat-containing protein [Phenylobacterium sp.]
MPSYFTSQDVSVALRSGFTTASVHEIAVGDFNGDGKADIALTYFLYPLEDRATPIRLLVGNGQGAFADQTSALFPGGAPQSVHPREAIAADFNRDGRLDLFIADHGYDASPFPGAQNGLFLSSGATGLVNATAQLPQVSDYSHSAEAADIDGDGDLDLFVGNGGGGTGWVRPFFLMNNGQGGFTRTDSNLPASLTAAGGPNHWSEAFIDIDSDGDKDLFLGSSLNTGSRLLLNNGAGVFTESGRQLPRGLANADAVDIQAFDANRDGRMDLILSYSVGTSNPQRQIQLLINDGQGGFSDETATRLPASMLTGDWVRRVQLADVNGDGLTDLVLSNNATAPFFLADGTGKFVAMPNLLPGNQYDLITPVDVNGDGHVDFVAWRGAWDGAERLRVDLWSDPGTNQVGTAASEGFMADNRAATIVAGAGDDVIVGGGAGDYLRGGEGNDRIAGGGGFDDTQGNMGDDTVSGGLGPDWVVGGKDNDVLYGEEDHDVLNGNLGNDVCEGGEGNDVVRGGQQNDIVLGGLGDDWISGDRGDDTITGGLGADTFHTFGEAGIDRVTDFSRAQGDRVLLDAGTTYSVAQVGADTVITMGGGGQMTLVGVQMSSLTTGWIFGA